VIFCGVIRNPACSDLKDPLTTPPHRVGRKQDRLRLLLIGWVAVVIAGSVARAIVNTCGWRSLRGFGLVVVAGSFDELAVDEQGAGADERDQLWAVDRAPSSPRRLRSA
jgi:hypothetical protein